ncbi:unnamed protein product, partial [Meganyctiphanes norvegica]
APTACPVISCPACPTCPTTVSPSLNWTIVGGDRFVRFPQKMNWAKARVLCRSHNLDLYIPKQILDLAQYLDASFADDNMQTQDHHWLGAHGNGTHQVWLSGDAISTDPDDLWYNNAYNHHGINDCTFLLTDHDAYSKGRVLSAYRCTIVPGYSVLCG